MPDVMTVSIKGQITIPADIREKYDIKAGDKIFGEELDIGYVIKKPKKGLLEYKGFIAEEANPES